MSCIRRISRRELCHWAGSTFEAKGGKVVLASSGPEAEGGAAAAAREAAVRAVHLLGRDGSRLFGDQPAALARWCLQRAAAGPSVVPSWCGGGGDVWREAEADLEALQRAELPADGQPDAQPGPAAAVGGAWAQQQPADRDARCPISQAAVLRPHLVEGVPYNPRLLLRWLEGGIALHPSSGHPIHHPETVLAELRPVAQAAVAAATAQHTAGRSGSRDSGAPSGPGRLGRGRFFWAALVGLPAALSLLASRYTAALSMAGAAPVCQLV